MNERAERYETMVSTVNKYLLRAGYSLDLETKVKNLEIANALITREINDSFSDEAKEGKL